MELINQTLEEGFTLLGFFEYPEMQMTLFFLFFVAYIFCLGANIFLTVIISLNSNLHTPMYFFICNLSFIDISLNSLILPKLLLTFLNMRSISLPECMIQSYLYMTFQNTEYFLLTIMSYDRYVAICRPLHYHLVLNKKMCIYMNAVTWILGFIIPVPVTCLMTFLHFCKSHKVNYIFCDLIPLLQISCGDTSKLEGTLLIEGTIVTVPCFGLTLSSYISIANVILKIKSSRGKRKAFSTCSSHLTVIIMLYLCLLGVYFQPLSESLLNNTKNAPLLNIILIPVLNPILYSLRNREVKEAFQKFLKVQ